VPLIVLSSFLFVALRAFQQLNVMHHRVSWVIPTSALMSICEVTVLLGAVKSGWWSWVPMFIGGSSGCLCAMWAHRRWR